MITDIQGSSRLWAACAAEMNEDIEKHDRLLRHTMLLYNGIELATEGDCFQARFVAVNACSLCTLPGTLPPPQAAPLRGRGACSLVCAMQVMFRDARDALRWCIAVQIQLLRVDWSARVMAECPAEAGIVTAPDLDVLPAVPGSAIPQSVSSIPALGTPAPVCDALGPSDCAISLTHIGWQARS